MWMCGDIFVRLRRDVMWWGAGGEGGGWKVEPIDKVIVYSTCNASLGIYIFISSCVTISVFLFHHFLLAASVAEHQK